MSIMLDHVSHYVRDRDVAAATLRRLGLNATPGGVHPGFGSANNLCYFGLFYIELLAIVDRAEALNGKSGVCRQAADFLEAGEGFGNIAFETETLDEAVVAMRANGLTVADPIRMERVQPDGFVSISRIAYPSRETPAPIPIPILIERSIGSADREPMLRRKGVIAEHAAGRLVVDHVGVCTADLNAARLLLTSQFGLNGAVTHHDDSALNSRCCRIETTRGAVVLFEPYGPGRAQSALARHGGGPFMLGIRSQDRTTTTARLGANDSGWVGPDALHGALLRLL